MKKITLCVFTLFICLSFKPLYASKQTKQSRYTAKYMTNVQKKIRRKWHPPEHKKSYVLIATFKINFDGEISGDIKFNKTIDNPKIMQSAKEAIYSAAPFKKIKREFITEEPSIEFTFTYNQLKEIDDDGDLEIEILRQKK